MFYKYTCLHLHMFLIDIDSTLQILKNCGCVCVITKVFRIMSSLTRREKQESSNVCFGHNEV